MVERYESTGCSEDIIKELEDTQQQAIEEEIVRIKEQHPELLCCPFGSMDFMELCQAEQLLRLEKLRAEMHQRQERGLREAIKRECTPLGFFHKLWLSIRGK